MVRPTVGQSLNRLTVGLLDDATDAVVSFGAWLPRFLIALPGRLWRHWRRILGWPIAGPVRATITMLVVASFSVDVGAWLIMAWPLVMLGYLGRRRRRVRLA